MTEPAQHLFVYQFTGTWSGWAKYDYPHPQVEADYQCLLFLLQDSPDNDFDKARDECVKYGFGNLRDLQAGPLPREALDTKEGEAFRPCAEEALRAGSALAWFT